MIFRRDKSPEPKPGSRVFAATITPRRPGQIEADIGALFELLDFVAARGVSGIALYGSTGEFTHYTLDERARVASLCIKRSRVPVLVNVSHSTFEGTVFLAESAAGAGAAGMLVMPPHYFRYNQEDIEAFFLAVGGAASQWAPLYLYNIPVFASPMEARTSVRLLQTGMFAGIKDSGGDWAEFEMLTAARATHAFDLFTGNDRLFTRAKQAGASGIISGIACALPELLVAIDAASENGRLDARLQEFITRIEQLPAPVGIREAVGLRGIQPGPHAAPLGETGLKALFEFREWFKGWLPVVLRECKDA